MNKLILEILKILAFTQVAIFLIRFFCYNETHSLGIQFQFNPILQWGIF